jgi:undecaprenyl-diphosphatase
MTAVQAILIAVLQGATELFPVSSLGHAVVLPAVFGSSLDQRAPEFLPFLVMLHVGTAVALLAFFGRDWWLIATGLLGIGSAHQVRESRRVFAMVVVATIPAVIFGFVLEKFVRGLFASPVVAAAFLIVNGAILFGAERLRTRERAGGHRKLSSLRAPDALAIGFWQCLALIPGISRSGATIVGGLLRGFDHEGAGHFSFIIATPVILGVTVLEVPKLLRQSVPEGVFLLAVLAAVVAGITAFVSTAILMRWFRNNDQWALDPFAWYCAALGGACLAVLLLA